ncbi:MAG: hypothetical protein WEF86_13480 [Gemmatimonadota bacterium]
MDPTLLIIILFVVAPLIEKILRAGKQRGDAPPPPAPMPRPRPRTEREAGEVARLPTQAGPAEADRETAAAVLPDDLWEILTGERRTSLPPPTSAPPQTPPDSEYETEDAEPAFSYDDVVMHEQAPPRPQPPSRSTSYDDRLIVREPPQIVSLERTSFDDVARHSQFHHRLEALPARERVRRPRRARAVDFVSQADLRRAIITNEVLGPPRGLEPGGL